MAADEKSARMRKKMKDHGFKKLVPGEQVEVLYSEEGLKGSWHFGVIIDCGMFSRTVELANLLSDDSCSKLVDTVRVSAAIEGQNSKVSKLHRNWIRPLPPKCKIEAAELIYGLCVDAFVDDAWWEGVVFDLNDGSPERLIFFPDQGDQQVLNFENLRITQEWNEVSGQWKPRGMWQFLQVIKKFELEGPLPVSVREIWYDLRSTNSFLEKIGVWISGSELRWNELVAEMIRELQSVVNVFPVEVSTSYDVLCENPMNFDAVDCSRDFLSVRNGNFLRENVGISSVSVTNFPQLLSINDQSSCHTPACENHVNWSFFHEGSQLQASEKEVFKEQAIISSSSNRPNNTQQLSPNVKNCDYSLKCASIERLGCDSHGKVVGGFQEIAQTNYLNSTSVSNSLVSQIEGAESKDGASDITALGSSETWQLIDLEAENCAEAIPLYLNDQILGADGPRRSKSREKGLCSLRLRAKRHLVALGWNIEASRERGSLRVRFVSPMGQCYSSLRSACFGLLGRLPEKNPKPKLNKLKSLDGFHFVSRSYEHFSMNSKGETDYNPNDNSFNLSLPVAKKRKIEGKMEGYSDVGNLNGSNGDTKSSSNLRKKCRMPSGMKKCNVMPNNCVMDDKSSFDFAGKKQAEFGHSSSERGHKPSKASHQKFAMHNNIEPENFPGAITQYINYRKSKGMVAKKQSVSYSILKLNAKKHLLYLGWRILKAKYGLLYVSPSGKEFHCLYSACKACFEDEIHGVGTSRSLLNGTTRRKLDYFSRETKPLNIDDKVVRRVCRCATAMANGVEKVCTDSNRSTESMAFGGSQSSSKKCGSKKKRKASSTSDCVDQTLVNPACEKLEMEETSPAPVRKRRRLASSSSFHVRRSSKRSQEVDSLSSTQHVCRTVLSLLIENDVVLPRQKVKYICEKDGHIMREGRITREGIKCKCCSKIYTLSNFEIHAGSNLRRPAANIFLKDGRSLLQCQIQMLSSKISDGFQRSRLKSDFSIYESDNICSVCHDGGSLILCDHCPSSFHLDCVGLKDVPEDKWFCPSCHCHICGASEFNPDTDKFTDKTILYCDQCEHEFHVGCLRKREWKSLQSCPTGNWFCSKSCSKIFHDLRKLVGISRPTSVEGLSCTILRSCKDYRAGYDQFDSEVQAEHHSKLCVALKVLHECFVSIIEPRTQSDIVADILFNKESELKRLNFYGFYAMLLEKGDELVSVATFRIYGDKIAEMPLIGTRIKYRRQGMCRLLLCEVEKLLVSIGVERFLLPAVPQLLETWTSSFGFEKMSSTDRSKLLKYTVLNFQDTTLCQKLFKAAPDNCSNSIYNFNSKNHQQAQTIVDNNNQAQTIVLALPSFINKSSPLLITSGSR